MPNLFPPLRVASGFGGGRPLKNGGGGWNLITARTNASILNNNAAPVLDPELKISVAAGKTYAFVIEAYFSANGAQDSRDTLGGTCTLTELVAFHQRTDNTNVLNPVSPTLYTPAPFTSFPASIVNNTSLGEWSGPVVIKGTVTPATSGTFGFAWCQGTAASAVNPTTRRRGSFMQWKQVD